MISLVPVCLLLITSIAILVIRIAHLRFSYYWFLASCGTLLTWLAVLVAQVWIPTEWTITTWQPEELFPISPILRLDNVSWSFALALVTLVFAATLTDVVHPEQADQPRSCWSDFAGWLAISAAGLLVILAGNLIALLLSWAILDALEISLRLTKTRKYEQVKKIIRDYSWRICSILLAAWAGLLMSVTNRPSNWDGITAQAAQILFLAVLIRVGVLPIRSPGSNEQSLSRTFRTLSSLVPVFSSLTLLPRLALPVFSQVAFFSPMMSTILSAWLGITALFCGLAWANASDEMHGLRYWTAGIAALSLASALYGQPTASMIWGIALPLTGGLLFIFSLRREWLLPLPLLGAVFFTAIPLTPTWQGAVLYTSHFNLLTVPLIIGHGWLTGGFIQHSLRSSPKSLKAERWTWIFLPWGLIMLALIHFAIAWTTLTSTTAFSFSSLPWNEWWPGFMVLAIAGIPVFWSLRGHAFPDRLLAFFRLLLSFDWLDQPFLIIDKFLQALFFRLNLILEGNAGILWAMLLLTLLLSITP